MKLNTTIRANADPSVLDHLKRISYQVNLLSEGRIAANYTAVTSAPTTGIYEQGYFVRNREPTGANPVLGWLCTASPNTFVAIPASGGSATVGYARTFLLMGA